MKVYIIDTYDKYMKQGNEKAVYWVHGLPYCIREVEMQWGLPVIQNTSIEYEVPPQIYNVFEEYDAAVRYIKQMQRLNGGLLD